MAVPRRIAGVVANHVVIRNGLLRLHDAASQIVVVEQSLAAGIAGQGKQRVLRLLEVAGVGLGRAAGVHPGIARRALRRIPQRRLGDQPSCIDRPERNARANGGVDRGMKLGLVIDPVESESAGKVDKRLLLVELAEHLGSRLQRGKLSIGVEDVELAIVLAKCGPGIGATCIVDGLSGTLTFAHDHGLENAEQLIAIRREVLKNVDRSALVAENGDQVDTRHLRAQKLLRRRERAELIRRPHRGHVKVKREQTLVLVSAILRRLGRDLRPGKLFVKFDLFRARRRWRHRPLLSRKILVLDEPNRLRAPSSVIVKSLPLARK